MSGVNPSALGLKDLVGGYTNPHGLYDALREREHVSYDKAGRCWLVTAHAEARKILSDERFVSDPALAGLQQRRSPRASFVSDAVQKQIIFADGPRQAKVQRAVLVELSRRTDSLQEPLRASAQALAARARERGEMDLVKDFAIPFSLEAITMVLGLPEEGPEMVERLERWSTIYADITSGYLRMDIEEIVLLGDYIRAQVAARGGTPSDDLIGAYMRDAGLETDEDVVIQSMMAFAAGRVTTQKLLGNGIPLLIPEWGAWREQARANPSLIRRLSDELLRVVTPTRYLVRYATADVALEGEAANGAVVKRGEKVVLFLEAANRDPATFSAPHSLEGERQPNPHVAFGFGAHRCPGASVARLEVQVALQVLLETIAELRPHPTAAPAWEPNPNLGGYASYPCVCS